MLLLRVVQGITLCAALGVAFSGTAAAAPGLPTDPWRLCPEAIAAQERAQAIPKHLLSAIALAESARKHPTFGKRMPWPWTVMAEGEGRYLPTKAAAIEEVRGLQARGIRNIDVGCMQVNLYHHADAFYSLDNAFDPGANVAYASKFLRSLFDDWGSWQEAAGRYHSATPELKGPYRDKVFTFWNEQQRLELVGSSTFGLGPLTAGAGSGGGVAAGPGQRVRSPALMLSLADRRAGLTAGSIDGDDRAGWRTYDVPPPSNGRVIRPGGAKSSRSLDEEAAFAARRAKYLQELRQAIAEVKRSYAVRVARNDAPADPD
jgi:hypothetical protein